MDPLEISRPVLHCWFSKRNVSSLNIPLGVQKMNQRFINYLEYSVMRTQKLITLLPPLVLKVSLVKILILGMNFIVIDDGHV